jgi:hypothetical protein
MRIDSCIQLLRWTVHNVKDLFRCRNLAESEPDAPATHEHQGGNMLGTILIVILILLLIGALPTWPHSKSWGYYPTGGIGLLLVIVVILLLLGMI